MTLRMGSLFAGYEGLGLGVSQVLDVELSWVSEIDPAPSRILAHHYPDVPNHGDITAIDWSQVEPVDVLTGGFPCQDVSTAGKRAGMKPGTRTGLWSHMAYAIDQLQPRLVVAENVRGLLSAEAHRDMESCPWCVGDGPASGLRALGAVLGGLADLGYDARWCGLRAADVGAPHGRFRVFVVAWPATDTVCATGERQPDASEREAFGGAAAGWGGAVPAADAEHGGRDGRAPAPVRLTVRRASAAGSGEDAAADTDRIAVREQSVTERGRGSAAEPGQPRTDAAPDSGSERPQGHTEPDGVPGEPARPSHGVDPDGRPGTATRWGVYEPAIRRWQRILGRVAPPPTEPGRTGNPRLSPRFVEWLMGLPDGWVTDVPGISRNDMLKALGNGVVPQQASAALQRLLTHDQLERAA